MYAIIENGSKQYRVENGMEVDLELLLQSEDAEHGDVENNGDHVTFKKVLLLSSPNGIKVGAPYVSECKVKGTIIGPVKGPKELTFKYKRRKGSTRSAKGHRQHYSRVKITEITG